MGIFCGGDFVEGDGFGLVDGEVGGGEGCEEVEEEKEGWDCEEGFGKHGLQLKGVDLLSQTDRQVKRMIG